MRNNIYITALALLLSAAASAQTAVAPPPQPADNGPSLAVTMQFIQAKMNEVGKINFAAYTHDNANGQDFVDQISVESGNVVADPAACRISYHRTLINNGAPTIKDFTINLRDVLNLSVITGDMAVTQAQAEGGHPARNSRVEPPIFVLVVKKAGNQENWIYLSDEEMANRIAKAMVHAVELCGGGNKEPF
jgi:hypothetical protein